MLYNLESAYRIYPNRKFIGMTWRLWAHKIIHKEDLKPGGFRYSIKEVFGEPPTYVDDDELVKTILKMQNILKQDGYFNSQVKLEIDSTHKKGWGVVFHVELNERWEIDNVVWSSATSGLPIEKLTEETLVLPNEPLSFRVLKLERTRLSEEAGRIGYATFNEGFVKFSIDTIYRHGGADVTIHLRGMKPEGTESTVPHKSMKIGDVFYDQSQMDRSIRQDVLSHLVTLEKGAGFDPKEFESSYRRLSGVAALSRVELSKDFPYTSNVAFGIVDVTVELRDSPRHNAALEFDMTRADTRYGPLGKFIWTNKNATGRGDVISWIASASIASTQPFSYGSSSIIPNSGEFGLRFSYRTIGLPPKKLSSLPKSTSPYSELIIQASRESRPEYSNTSLNYRHRIEWTENALKNSVITIDVLNLSFVELDLSKAFSNWLDESEDALLLYRFSDYALIGSRVGWSSNIHDRGGKVGMGVEWSGMLSNSIVPEINGVSVIQFARVDCQIISKGDVRHRTEWNWASRFRIGSAFVGSETEVLPYDKGYFGGGANGIRGWAIRELGPGNFSEVNNPNGILKGVGDTRIEASAELRMNWSAFTTIAVFTDLGNIWLNDSGLDDGTSLKSAKFSSIAFSSGVGVRLDFDFFIVRLDAAIRMHDPTKINGERWIFETKPSGAIHLGLGHPF